MLSKIMRSKSSAQDSFPPSQLTGMPALKQRRSSERNLQLSSDFLPPRSKSSCKSVEENFAENCQEKLARSTPDLLKTVPDRRMHAPSDETKAYINEVTNGHLENSESTIPHDHSKPVRTELHFQRATEDSLGVKIQPEQKIAKERKKKKDKKNIDKGRGLHSVKKQRQAERQCFVSDSMRALTPQERESIKALEESWKDEYDGDSAASDVESNDVFSPSPIPSVSSSSSVGSIIDLVSTPPSTPRAWNHYVIDDIYAEIGDEQLLNRDEAGEKCDKAEDFDSEILTPSTVDNEMKVQSPGYNVEPIYSVVIKPKRKIDKAKPACDEGSSYHTSIANSHGDIHVDKNVGNGHASNHRSNSSDSISVTPLRPQRFSYNAEECDVIDESMKAKPSQFTVVPSKTMTRESAGTSFANESSPYLVNNKSHSPSQTSSSPSFAFSRLSISSSEDSQGSSQSSSSFSPRDQKHSSRPFMVTSASRSICLD